jgi:putative oxidoreductase
MIKGQSLPQQETIRTVGLARYTTAFAPYTLTILRILVGITFLLHGLPKLSGLEGFTGFVASLGFPLPGFFAILVAALEVGGGLLLILGLATRWVSLLLMVQMLITTLLVKLPNAGFINQQQAGAELDLLLAAAALVLLAFGPGPLSVERNVLKREM